MPRLLHTADWQIGKPYRWIDDPERRSRLQRARIEAVERIIELIFYREKGSSNACSSGKRKIKVVEMMCMI